MPIHVWGTDFRRSESSFRSQLFVPAEVRAEKLKSVLGLGFRDVVYLHTCNRVEFYATANDHFTDTRQSWLKLFELFELDKNAFFKGYHLEGKSAVRHLVRVAASLESMVVGEPQILGQLKEALAWTRSNGLPVTNAMDKAFQMAFCSAKMIRTKTSIGENPVSVATLALQRMARLEPDFAIERVAIIGRSPISVLVRRWFEKNRPEVPIVWANRNPELLKQLPESRGCEIVPLDNFLEKPPSFSHLFTATGSKSPLMGPCFFEKLPNPKGLVFDFAHPPDVEAKSARGWTIFQLETLIYEAESNEEKRASAVLEATKIIESRLRDFYLEQKETPLLRDFNQLTPELKQTFEHAKRELETLVDENRLPLLTKWAEDLVKKNLHQSREHLKDIIRKAALAPKDPAPL